MSNIFMAVRLALSAIDTALARTILLFWVSTLEAQLRHERELQH
jgi:hypothetical protein